jgi:hypothetical protein
MKWIPKIISLIFLWGSVAYIILYVDPDLLKDILIPGLYLPFFVMLTIALWYTIALLTKSAGKSLLITITLVGAIMLTTLKLMFAGLALVILLTLGIESWYIYKSHEKNHTTHEQKDRVSGL